MVNDKGALFSECGQYRYRLWRIWDTSKPLVMCIGLNPSTANKDQNDNTITRLESLIKANGYGGFYMMNLFGYITPHPKELKKCSDPVGENHKHLLEVSALCRQTIFCWGHFSILSLYDQFAKRVVLMESIFPSALCFGFCSGGEPRHPLMLRKDTRLISYKNNLKAV